MPGGGRWKVAPGQITDDGELTLCLARALARKAVFDSEEIAKEYTKWVRSWPFDIGRTTSRSMGSTKWGDVGKRKGYSVVMSEAAFRFCMRSKANGSLMRATPMGIWGHRFDDDVLASYAQTDSKLSHPNPSCLNSVACYVIAIANLMRNLGDNKKAFNRAAQWDEANANQEVQGWLRDAENNAHVAYYPHAGFVKYGFTHAFRHLLLGTDYAEAIQETLTGGGDTDTNACIVGGLLGAAYGASAIPIKMQEAVLHCDTQKGAHPRPEFLQTTQIPTLARSLIEV